MDRRFGRLGPTTVWGLAAALATGAVCTYDPPPEVRLVAPPGNRFRLGDPIVLAFSEPVKPESLSIRVWPGRKDLYDIEGERLPGVVPIMDRCTVRPGSCNPGVDLTLSEDRRTATMTVAEGALGPEDQPLVLEVEGSLEDDRGRRKKVSRFFDFQIVRTSWNPYQDVLGDSSGREDAGPSLPVRVTEGPHFFFAFFTSPIELPQQYWCDLRVIPETGRWIMILHDADPKSGAPRNTSDPRQCVVDTGPEGFIFTAQGTLRRPSEGADPVFEGEPFTLTQTIGPVTFQLRDMVMYGTVSVQDGRSRWDGTIAVREVYYQVGDLEEVYPADQANFQIVQILGDEIPDGMARVCDADPCSRVGGRCDLPPGPWPQPAFCP